MEQLIKWTPVDFATLDGKVKSHLVARIRFLSEGGWKIHPVPADQDTLSGRYDSLEGAKAGAELWWAGYIDSLGLMPVPQPPDPRELEDLVREITDRVVLIKKIRNDDNRRRIAETIKYMEGIISPSQITLDHIRRHLDGTYDTH